MSSALTDLKNKILSDLGWTKQIIKSYVVYKKGNTATIIFNNNFSITTNINDTERAIEHFDRNKKAFGTINLSSSLDD